jgi:KaiC/GvpD/RAD55 family RecA-like ATPase
VTKMEKDKVKIKIVDLLRSHPEGLTIADIMKRTQLARHTVLARLHGLIGEDKVGVRKVNMAKLHIWKPKEEEERVEQGQRAKLVELEERNIKNKPIETKKKKIAEKEKSEEGGKPLTFDFSKIKEEIESELKGGKIKKDEAQIKEQRIPVSHFFQEEEGKRKKPGKNSKGYVKTDIPGFDKLFEAGIPKGSSVLVAGGAGSGKTIFCLQVLFNKAKEGKKCFYMSFEESESRLMEHMNGFGWDAKKLIKEGNLKIQRFNPFDITRNVDALLAKQKGELLIDIDPLLLPEDFKPDFIVLDSLTAIASAFTSKEDSYRIYIEQLFRFFEKIGATTLLITETEQMPKVFSATGVEEFLADGVIVLYNIKKAEVRENAIEVLKMRGERHQKKIVAMRITDEGIVVYPEQEIFGGIEEQN